MIDEAWIWLALTLYFAAWTVFLALAVTRRNRQVAAAVRLMRAYEERIAHLKTAVRMGLPGVADDDVRRSIAMDADRDVFGDIYEEDR